MMIQSWSWSNWTSCTRILQKSYQKWPISVNHVDHASLQFGVFVMVKILNTSPMTTVIFQSITAKKLWLFDPDIEFVVLPSVNQRKRAKDRLKERIGYLYSILLCLSCNSKGCYTAERCRLFLKAEHGQGNPNAKQNPHILRLQDNRNRRCSNKTITLTMA